MSRLMPIPILLAGLLLSWSGDAPQERPAVGPLDGSGAFFRPPYTTDADSVVAHTKAGAVLGSTYVRYLAARFGDRYLEDLVFDDLLARECKERKLAGNAPLMARSLATQRFHGAGREIGSDPRGDLRRKFANEELRRLRAHALAGVDRAVDPVAIDELFNRRFGVGGQKVKVRQVLVSSHATRLRLGDEATDAAVDVAARSRAEQLRARLQKGDPWIEVLKESDDRTARRLLRDPEQREKAGLLDGYNYRRYGAGFAKVVRGLEIGVVSDPVKTTTGYHLVQVISRKTTRLKDVLGVLRRELRSRPASQSDIARLKNRLFEKYEVKIP